MGRKRRLWCIYGGTTQLFDDDDEELCLVWQRTAKNREKSETRVDVCLGPLRYQGIGVLMALRNLCVIT